MEGSISSLPHLYVIICSPTGSLTPTNFCLAGDLQSRGSRHREEDQRSPEGSEAASERGTAQREQRRHLLHRCTLLASWFLYIVRYHPLSNRKIHIQTILLPNSSRPSHVISTYLLDFSSVCVDLFHFFCFCRVICKRLQYNIGVIIEVGLYSCSHFCCGLISIDEDEDICFKVSNWLYFLFASCKLVTEFDDSKIFGILYYE